MVLQFVCCHLIAQLPCIRFDLFEAAAAAASNIVTSGVRTLAASQLRRAAWAEVSLVCRYGGYKRR